MASPPEMKPIFLVLGKKGVGKSALVNSLVGEEKFCEVSAADLSSGTDIKETESDGIKFFETTDFTPDSIPMSYRGTNSKMLFCLKMADGVKDDDRRLMQALNEPDKMIWNRIIFVLTNANKVSDPEDYDEILHQWEEKRLLAMGSCAGHYKMSVLISPVSGPSTRVSTSLHGSHV